MKLKDRFKILLNEPLKTFIPSVVFGIASNYSHFLYKIFNIPQIASESDKLSVFQILLGFLTSLLIVVLSLIAILFKILFLVSLTYFIYRSIFKSKSSGKNAKTKNS